MSETISIQPYKSTDLTKLLGLLKLNTPAHFAPEEEKDYIHYLNNEVDDYFVVYLHETIIACGGINYKENGTTGYISWDMVHPLHQGKGIGSLLLEHRIELLKSNPTIQKIVVRTTQFANRFYAKHEFQLCFTEEDFWAKGFDLYHMEYLIESK